MRQLMSSTVTQPTKCAWQFAIITLPNQQYLRENFCDMQAQYGLMMMPIDTNYELIFAYLTF